MLADALVGMAEVTLEASEPLPRPDPSAVPPGFDRAEPIRLRVTAAVEPAGAAP